MVFLAFEASHYSAILGVDIDVVVHILKKDAVSYDEVGLSRGSKDKNQRAWFRRVFTGASCPCRTNDFDLSVPLRVRRNNRTSCFLLVGGVDLGLAKAVDEDSKALASNDSVVAEHLADLLAVLPSGPGLLSVEGQNNVSTREAAGS